MRHTFAAYLLTLIFLSVTAVSDAQEVLLKHSTFFESGRSELSKPNAAELMNVIQGLDTISPLEIELEGNTDDIGNIQYNKWLSEQRAKSVKRFFVQSGFLEENIFIKPLGPENPIATNRTIAGRKLNRRVDILVRRTGNTEATAPAVPDISELYEQLATEGEVFCINNLRDTVIRCKKGTVIYLKANCFTTVSNCFGRCISFKVKEDFLKSDIILDNLSTTSNGEIIETQGMIYTEATDCNGNMLELQKGKDLVIVVPTDSINPQAKIFDGIRTHDSIMNWTVNNNSVLSGFTLPDLDICGGWICKVKDTILCAPCRFFFCRIGRIGKSALGTVSGRQRARNIIFRQCQSRLKKIRDRSAEVVSTNPTVISTRPPLPVSLVPKCQALEALFKRYDVKNMDSLILAINKPLLDSFKVSTIAALEDTLRKINRRKIELSYLDYQISFEDFKYYIYNRSRLGWGNIDVFAALNKSALTTLKVNLTAAANIDCKLVFKNRRFVIPATKGESRFSFPGVPAGEEAVIVAIKYEDGKPYLALKKVIVNGQLFDIEFKQLTLSELKEELKQLD